MNGRAELAMEQDRFFDLIRTGQAPSALSNKGFTTGKHEVYPIPAAQMQLNPNLLKIP
jgi:starch-binding outer membrane protein, SusD/RagB family